MCLGRGVASLQRKGLTRHDVDRLDVRCECHVGAERSCHGLAGNDRDSWGGPRRGGVGVSRRPALQSNENGGGRGHLADRDDRVGVSYRPGSTLLLGQPGGSHRIRRMRPGQPADWHLLRPHDRHRCRTRTGFDYWLGRQDDPGPLFQNRARLEVSGIRSGTNSAMSTRTRRKLVQVDQSAPILPAVVIVVEFGEPRSRIRETWTT